MSPTAPTMMPYQLPERPPALRGPDVNVRSLPTTFSKMVGMMNYIIIFSREVAWDGH